MNFVGTTTVDPTSDNTITINGIDNYSPNIGDVIIYNGEEYVCTSVAAGKATWEKFGAATADTAAIAAL